MTSIARRYAKALIMQTGSDLGPAKINRDTFLDLVSLFSQDEAGRVLRNPVMPKDLKKAILNYGLDQLTASPALRSIVDNVVDVGRTELLPDIAAAYAAFIDNAEGKAHAEIRSAVELSAEEQQQIGQAMGQLLHKNVDVTSKLEPALLGGFTVRVGNYLVDLSLKTKLDGLATSAVADTIR